MHEHRGDASENKSNTKPWWKINRKLKIALYAAFLMAFVSSLGASAAALTIDGVKLTTRAAGKTVLGWTKQDGGRSKQCEVDPTNKKPKQKKSESKDLTAKAKPKHRDTSNESPAEGGAIVESEHSGGAMYEPDPTGSTGATGPTAGPTEPTTPVALPSTPGPTDPVGTPPVDGTDSGEAEVEEEAGQLQE